MKYAETTCIRISREVQTAIAARGTVQESYDDVLRKLLGLPLGGTQ